MVVMNTQRAMIRHVARTAIIKIPTSPSTGTASVLLTLGEVSVVEAVYMYIFSLCQQLQDNHCS